MLSIVLCAAGAALAQTEWVDHPDNPILGVGEPGAWDDGGRWVVSVIRVDETYHLWYGGSDDPLEANGIGHATSPDGVEWTMDPANPVLTRGEPGAWDRWFWFPSPAVMYDGSEFHMWYAGTASTSGTLIQGGYATSPDGSAWTKYEGNPVLEVGPPGSWDDRQVRPASVILDGETYKMWYSGFGASSGIGYAESPDGIDWTKHPEPVLGRLSYPGGWDKFPADPSVVFDGSLYHMWYAGRSTGDWMIGYAFSTDGIGWSRHRGNPVVSVSGEDIYTMPVVFDGSMWHGWYGFGYGQALNYATSDHGPGVPGMSTSRFIPAAAVASGAEGAFFTTDVDLSNRGSQPVEYQLMWLPRGEDNSECMTSETFSLGAGMSVRYANVLSEVFDLQPDSLGALAILSSSPDLLSMSRIYNTPSGEPAGTYGQAMQAVTADDFIGFGEQRRILFATENGEMRTNVGCVNGTGSVVGIDLELFDMEGTSLGTEMMILPAWGNDQINRIFEEFAPITGYVEVSTRLQNRSFYCYGSVLDNTTSDPTTIPPQ